MTMQAIEPAVAGTPEEAPGKAAVPRPEAAARRATFVASLSVALLVAGLGVWLRILPRIDPQGLTDYGIVAILPPAFWIAAAALALGFTLSLDRRLAAGPLPYLHLLGLVALLHATPAIAYGTLRYSWAWKHIGIVDFIQRHGWVDPVAPFLAAYHNWPGLFYVSAKIANALHLAPVDIAHWVRFAPVVLQTLFIFALIPIYRRITDDPRLVAAAIWLFLVGNWIGQDYYSPQGVAYLAHLLIIGICLGPLGRKPFATAEIRSRFLRPIVWAQNFAQHAPSTPMRPVSRLARAAYVSAVLLLILMITATHQLTPIALGFSLLALVLLGRLNIYFVIFVFVAEILWLLYFAAPFISLHLADELNNIGEGINAAEQRLIDISIVSPGRVWVIIIGRVLTVGVVALAGLGGLRRLIAGYRDGIAVFLALAAFPLLLNRYGGEILFRVYLFSLPMLAFFAASMFFPTRDHGHHPFWRALFWPAAVMGIVGFLFANNGKDRQYYFTPDEIKASLWLYGNAPPDSLLIEGSRNYPSQFMNYENFTYLPVSEEKKPVRDEIVATPEDIFARWLSDPKWKAGYVIITSTQKAYSDAEGVMPRGALDAIERRLLLSPRFILAYATPNAKIFQLHPRTGTMGPWTRTMLDARDPR